MARRLLLSLLIVLCAAGGCHRTAEELSPPPVPEATRRFAGVSITYYGDSHELGRTLERSLIQRFEQDTGIRVNLVPRPESTTETYVTYDRQFKAAEAEVDVYLIDLIWPAAFAPYLLDLTPTLATEARNHLAMCRESDTVGGRLVAMPYFLDLGLLYYRKDLLEQHGYARPPVTWEQLEAMARDIQSGERSGGRDLWGFIWQGLAYEGLTCNALEWQESHGGGGLIDPRTGQVSVDDPRAIAAFRRAAGWIGTITPPAVISYDEPESLDRFREGGAVFMRNWAYVHAGLEAADSPIRGKVGVAGLPAAAGHRSVSVMGGWQLGVSRRSRHPEAAVAFVRYLTSPEVQAWRAREGSYLPTVQKLWDDPGLRSDLPLLAAVAPQLPNMIQRPSGRVGPRYNAFSTYYYEGVEAILEGEAAGMIAARMQRDMVRLLAWPESSVRTP